MGANEMPIFTRMTDLLAWLLPATNGFPTAQRHTFTKRLLDSAFDLYEWLERANHERGAARAAALREADTALDRVRLYIRLAVGWKWLSPGQYKHVAEMLRAGWCGAVRSSTPVGSAAARTATGGARTSGSMSSVFELWRPRLRNSELCILWSLEPFAELQQERSGRSPTLQKKRPIFCNGGTTSVSSAGVL